MGGITFRRLERVDFPLLVSWFADPVVAAWWDQPADLDAVIRKYEPRLTGVDPTTMWVIEVDEVPAGMVQCYLHADHPDHDARVGIAHAVGIDYLLGDSHRGRGLAARVLTAFAARALESHPTAAVCVATPAEANAASCRSLERAGFARRSAYELPDGRTEVVYVIGDG